MLLLNLATRLADYQKAVGEGRWQQAKQFCLLDYPIVELEGKTLGLLGHGELGGAVARSLWHARAVGQIPGRPARPDRLPLEELLPQIDALTLHCPLNEHTRHFIGARELASMKPGAFVVNTARGGLIDEQALADALRNGHLGGAATDVLSVEPPTMAIRCWPRHPATDRHPATPGAVAKRGTNRGSSHGKRSGVLQR
jgi:glycerate dehydrogenase